MRCDWGCIFLFETGRAGRSRRKVSLDMIDWREMALGGRV